MADYRPWEAASTPTTQPSRASKPWEKHVIDIGTPALHAVNWTMKQLAAPLQGITEGLVGPTIRHGANLFTGRENLRDVAADLPNAPRHLWEAVRASIPPAIPGRGRFTGPQNVSEEMQAAGLDQPSADVLSTLTEMGIGGGVMNKVGEKALLPAGRAIANAEIGGFRTRKAVAPVLEFFKQGSSLPNSMRDEFYRTLRTAEGAADWRGFLREKQFGKALGLPEKAQDAITNAIETKTIASLPPASQDVANALVKEYRSQVGGRLKAGLIRYELQSPTGLEFAPRIPTKEARVNMELKPYGDAMEGGKPGLSTAVGKPRTELGRILTTEQMSGGKRAFEPVMKATMIHGAKNDAAIMHADIIRSLDSKFGRPVRPGEASIASLKGVPTGFNTATKARLEGRALPPELHRVVERLNETFKPQQWGKASETIRVVNDQFRKWALFSPGFISRNMQNNLVQNSIAGNNNPATWIESFGQRVRMAKGIMTKADKAEVEEMIRAGVIGKGQVAIETGGKVRGAYNAPFNWMRNVNGAGEDVSRMALYKHFRSVGKSVDEAADQVNNYLFNYSPRFQSKGFSALRRTAFPFINWKAQVPQLFVRSAIGRPGSLGQVGNIRSKLDAGFSVADSDRKDYQVEQGAVAIGPNRDLVPQGVGQFDVNSMTAPVGKDLANVKRGLAGKTIMGSAITDELASNSYPQYAITYAFATGRDPFTGWPIRDWGKFFIGKVPAAKIPLLVKDLAEKKPGAKERALSFATGIRTVERK